MNTITLDSITRAKHQLSIVYFFNDYRFEVSLWYEGVDLLELENKYGKEYLEWIYFHIAAFEFNKLISLKPEQVDFGCYQKYCTEDFFTLWTSIQHKVWAQWRYENNIPHYKEPTLAHDYAKSEDVPAKVSNDIGTTEVLVFCGGGKDSLVSARIFETLDIPYASFVYSSSIYGTAQKQHRIIDGLLNGLKPAKIHRQYVYDSFVDCPILDLDASIQSASLTAAETPSSIFASLPLILSEGYQYIALGHEKSANVGNLIWDVTGEDVNHQWGKSYAAEVMINSYIKNCLVDNFHYFSILQPIYDVLIFNLLRESLDLVEHTHSCNIDKPWCKKCPKCAYVWLNYMAYLPTSIVNEMFGEVNLFDIEENQIWFKQMLGLGEHTPFECIGQIEESRLAFHICKKKGLQGKALELYDDFKDIDFQKIAIHFTAVDDQQTGYPDKWKRQILRRMNEVSATSVEYIARYF
ncbi:MAG: hypothetical protein R3E32_10145 [Chitinophagales bacterium]